MPQTALRTWIGASGKVGLVFIWRKRIFPQFFSYSLEQCSSYALVLLAHTITSIFQTDEPRLNGFSALFKECKLISAEQAARPGSA